MARLNVGGPPAAVRAAARAGVGRLIHTSSAATIGEPTGSIGTEMTPTPRVVPLDVRADQNRRRARGAERGPRSRAGSRLRQPLLGAGSGTERRNRPIPARVPRRPIEGVRPDEHQPRRHRRLRHRTSARGRARGGGRAVSAQRHGLPDHRRAYARGRGRWSAATPAAVAASRGQGGRRHRRARVPARGPQAADLPGDGADPVTRPSLRRIPRPPRPWVGVHRSSGDAAEDRGVGPRGGPAPRSRGGREGPARPIAVGPSSSLASPRTLIRRRSSGPPARGVVESAI